MDPLSAVSLAGTIVQFVDFSTKLISSGRELYKSESGSIRPNEELELVTADLVAICNKLQHEEDLGPDFEDICNAARKIALELLNRLRSLKVTKAGGRKGRRRRETFQVAVSAAWSKSEIEGLESRLSKIRGAIDNRILFSLRENLDLLCAQSSERFNRLDRTTQQIVNALNAKQDLSHELLGPAQDQILAITQLLSRLEASNLKEHRKTREMIIDWPPRHVGPDGDGRIIASPEPLEVPRNLEEKVWAEVDTEILQSLCFPTMTARYDDIAEPYNKTFDWVFYDSTAEQRPWSSFKDWLISGSGVYWVNGKAGSGKSTLMRHIYDDQRTQQYLLQWTKNCPLSTSGFFFWNSGTRKQRSQTGLLRALMYKILSQHPELIVVVFPQYWAKAYSYRVRDFPHTLVESWPLSKLMAGFRILVIQNIVPLNLCLFIDGLDEFEGDHTDISELFKGVTSSKTVKACVSSRPWVVFEENFGTCPSLRLQDLTRGDIEHYTTHKLRSSPTFKSLALRQAALATSLASEIVEYSSGVFLWVRLVVKSLMDGLRNRDDIHDLQRRLRLIPRDLEALYEHMLTRTDRVYLEKASKIFQLFRGAMNYRDVLNERRDHEGLTVLDLTLAINSDLNFDVIKSAQTSEISKQCEEMQIQLIASCAGLLEIGEVKLGPSSTPTPMVQYLHRTARDFIESPRMWRRVLDQTSSCNFNRYVSLMKSAIYQVPIMIHRRANVLEVAATGIKAMVYGYHAEAETHRCYTQLLDELDEILTSAIKSGVCPGPQINQHWSNLISTIWSRDTSFLSLAAQCGLSLYVGEKLSQGFLTKSPKGKRSLLYYSLRRNPWIHSPEMVELLLRSGEDPNKTVDYTDSTLWQMALRDLRKQKAIRVDASLDHRTRYLNIVKALVHGGANPKSHIRIYEDGLVPEVSAHSVIERAFGAEFPDEVRALQQELMKREAAMDAIQAMNAVSLSQPKHKRGLGSWFKKYT